MEKVKDNLYIADLNDIKNIEKMQEEEIDVIINLSGWSPDRIHMNKFTWVSIPIKDGAGRQHSFNTAVHAVINQINNDKKTVVNCAAGVSRSGGVLATAIAATQSLEFEKALNQVMEARPVVNPNDHIRRHGKKFLGETTFTPAKNKAK